jgi:hypothetical protein
MGTNINISEGKHLGKRPLGRSRRIWKYNIKMYLQEIGYDFVDWIHVAQGGLNCILEAQDREKC